MFLARRKRAPPPANSPQETAEKRRKGTHVPLFFARRRDTMVACTGGIVRVFVCSQEPVCRVLEFCMDGSPPPFNRPLFFFRRKDTLQTEFDWRSLRALRVQPRQSKELPGGSEIFLIESIKQLYSSTWLSNLIESGPQAVSPRLGEGRFLHPSPSFPPGAAAPDPICIPNGQEGPQSVRTGGRRRSEKRLIF